MDHHICLKNDLSEISRVAGLISGIGKKCGWSDEIIFDLKLVSEEILSNIIFYAYEDKGEYRIDLRICITEKDVTLEFSDKGKFFNPLEKPPPDTETPFAEREPGGMGILLVCSIMDEIFYKRESGKNILTLKKNCPNQLFCP